MFENSVIFYQDVLPKSVPNKQQEHNTQTDPFELVEVGVSTSKPKAHEVQTIEFPSFLKRAEKTDISHLSAALRRLLNYVQNHVDERVQISTQIKTQASQTSQSSSNIIDISKLVQQTFDPAQTFYIYNQGSLLVHTNLQTFTVYPFYLQQREASLKNVNKFLSQRIKQIQKYLLHPLNKNMLITVSKPGTVSIVNIANGFEPVNSYSNQLLQGDYVKAEFVKSNQIKQFQIVVFTSTGRIVVLDYQSEKGIEPVGGVQLKLKGAKKEFESGKSVKCAAVSEISSDKKIRSFIGFEDGSIQLYEFIGERKAKITTVEELQDFTGQKILKQWSVKPPVQQVQVLDSKMIQGQQTFIQSVLRKFCFTLDGDGSLYLYFNGEIQVRYFSNQPILDFVILNRFVCVLTTDQKINMYQIFSDQPVQLPVQSFLLQNGVPFNKLELVHLDETFGIILAVDCQKAIFQLTKVPIPFDLVLMEDIGRQMFWSVQE
ncbi:Conserved_hypothetical protein [Hexamita inflata]|uniref:Uncharacterized protein n=1 Tax=Hexamita inflata TaxID=28002 RepID=A0AA86RA49_9EUKA|nr:Conserved hypothetical protein [Hexamita inflata]